MPDVHVPLKKHILIYAMHLYMYIYVYVCIYVSHFIFIIYTWSKIGVFALTFVRNLSGVIQMQSGVRGRGEGLLAQM